MKLISVLLTGALISSGGAPLRAEDEPVVLQPSTNWHLDYGEERCRLVRLFGPEDDQTVFWIEQTGPSASFSWLIAGGIVDHLGTKRSLTAAFGDFAPFDFNTSGEPVSRQSLELGKYGDALQGRGYERPKEEMAPTSVPPLLNLDAGARIDHVDFYRKGRSARLNTGQLKAAFDAMNACSANLYEHWGLKAGELDQIAQGARPLNMERVARRIQQHYPLTAERRGENATIELKMLIGVDGKVEKCIFIKKTKAENFDDKACQIMMSDAQFEPASDAQGNPVRDFYSATVHYHMQ